MQMVPYCMKGASVESNFLLVILVPIVLIFLVLGWFFLLARGGRPISLKLQGLGIKLELNSERYTNEG